MSMAEVGQSLLASETHTALLAKSQRWSKEHARGHVCRACGEWPYPRGFDVHSRLCWYCSFPRSEARS